MMMTFWVLYFYETFICYRGCLNLNCYIGKKVQKNFLMGPAAGGGPAGGGGYSFGL